jgi:CRP-like cAMP-binding protein
VASVWALMTAPLKRVGEPPAAPKRQQTQPTMKRTQAPSPKSHKPPRPSKRPVASEAVLETDYDLIVASRLSLAGHLSSEEREAAAATGRSMRRMHQAGDEIVIEGQRLMRPMFVVSGLACSMRLLPNGRRQFVSFLLPGDGVGLGHNVGARSATIVLALTTVQTVDATGLHALACQPGYEGLASALCGLALHQEEFHLNQMARLAMRSHAMRLAHLLSELRWRFRAAGLAQGQEMQLPVTFETLGEALGVSAEQAWATMLRLKATGRARFKWGRAVILRPRALQRWSEFRPPQVYETRSVARAPMPAAPERAPKAPALRRISR